MVPFDTTCFRLQIMCLAVGSGVTSLIPVRFHTFVGIDHEIISMAILLPSADSKSVFVSSKQSNG